MFAISTQFMGADQTLMNISPCRYRKPFVAQRGWTDSLVITCYRINSSFSAMTCLFADTSFRLLLHAFLLFSPHKRNRNNRHRRNSGEKRQKPSTPLIDCHSCIDSYVYGFAIYAPLHDIGNILISDEVFGKEWYTCYSGDGYHNTQIALSRQLVITHWSLSQLVARSACSELSARHYNRGSVASSHFSSRRVPGFSSSLSSVFCPSCAAFPLHNYYDHTHDGWVHWRKVEGNPHYLGFFPHFHR